MKISNRLVELARIRALGVQRVYYPRVYYPLEQVGLSFYDNIYTENYIISII